MPKTRIKILIITVNIKKYGIAIPRISYHGSHQSAQRKNQPETGSHTVTVVIKNTDTKRNIEGHSCFLLF
jgi:hypothetical protein